MEKRHDIQNIHKIEIYFLRLKNLSTKSNALPLKYRIYMIIKYFHTNSSFLFSTKSEDLEEFSINLHKLYYFAYLNKYN